jgi:alkylhydroperoxidase family enzyme
VSDDPRVIAPEAFAAFDVCFATATTCVAPDVLEAARTDVAAALGTSDGTAREGGAVSVFATQFVVDVSEITASQRGAAFTALGADAFDFVQCCYLFDLSTRLRAGFEHLLGTRPFATHDDVRTATSLFGALESMFAAVARLHALDPLTTELVRLRGARAHNCRLCKSIRSVRAARAGADESLYDQIDQHETSALDARHKAALRLTDAVIWQPLHAPDGLAADVRRVFTAAETTELLLDIARNAANKIAVAFGADAPHVTEGIEYYDVDDAGALVYGLTIDT